MSTYEPLANRHRFVQCTRLPTFPSINPSTKNLPAACIQYIYTCIVCYTAYSTVSASVHGAYTFMIADMQMGLIRLVNVCVGGGGGGGSIIQTTSWWYISVRYNKPLPD